MKSGNRQAQYPLQEFQSEHPSMCSSNVQLKIIQATSELGTLEKPNYFNYGHHSSVPYSENKS